MSGSVVMRVLIACEYSGIVRDAFSRHGHDAWSCDVLPTESPGQHYQGDVRDILGGPWDLIVAHPPCTRLANSGVRWLNDRNLWADLDAACEFFRLFLNLPGKVAIENPIPHKYALARIGRKYSQCVQPWQFGHNESKAICLWLQNLPLLQPTNIVNERIQRCHLLPPSPNRAKERSRFFTGVADAMAEQWSNPNAYQSELLLC
jgi:hypothetical protein